jgi:hypothetical protein
MTTLLYIILAGFLVRADGWGTKDPFWEGAAIFFDAWTCAALFMVISIFYFGFGIGLTCGAAFLIYRVPGFRFGGLPDFITLHLPPNRWLVETGAWTNYWNMFVRGMWPSALGFALISFMAHGHGWFALLAVPFAAMYAAIYVGGYKRFPETFLGLNQHVWIEHASGWLLAVYAMLIVALGATPEPLSPSFV